MEQENKEKFWTVQPELGTFHVIDYENIWREKHISSNNELLYVLDGKCTLEIGEGLEYPAVAGDFLLIPRHVLHRDVFEPLRGLRILMISFAWQEAEPFFQIVNNIELHKLDFATRSEVRRRLDFLHELWSKKLISRENVQVQLHALLLLFYCAVVHAAKAKEQTNSVLGHSKLIQQAKFFITQNFAAEITLEQTALRLGISPSYLSRLFQREFGVSFSTYLTTIRMENAVSLLHHTSLQIAEIAYRCGFKDSSYFIKTFRQHYGKTPGNFRS